MPLDVLNIVASQVILRNVANPPDAQTTARLSIASGLVPGPVGLVLPIVAGRAQSGGNGGGGAEGVIVPDVEGETKDAATTALEARHLEVAVRKAFSTDADKGKVMRQRPAAGSVRPLNSTVTIVVSDGAPPDKDDDDDDDAVTRAEFEAGMKKLDEKLDRLIKAHGADTGSSPSSTPAASGSPTTSGSRSRTS